MLTHLVIATAMVVSAASAQAVQKSTAVVLPAGTQIAVQVDQDLSSSDAKAGDQVDGELVVALVDNRKRVLVPQGTPVTLRVTRVVTGNRSDRPTELVLEMVSLQDGGHSSRIIAYPVQKRGEMAYANRGAQVATSDAVNAFGMFGGRFGVIGSLATQVAMAHNATPKSLNVEFHDGDVVSFVLSSPAVVTQ